MGDKSPRSKEKAKKLNDKKKADERVAHDKKQAPPAPPVAKKKHGA